MKVVLIALFKGVSTFIFFIWPYSASVATRRVFSKFYTFWISREFGTIGQSVLIDYPMNLVGGKYIVIGSWSTIGRRSILTAWNSYLGQTFSPSIVIGDNTSIGEDSHITCINKIIIGNGVLMGKKVTISDNAHGSADYHDLDLPPIHRPVHSKGSVVIEDNVWIGEKVTILANVHIGRNSIVGANAVVTKDIPENSIAGGVPARVLKKMK